MTGIQGLVRHLKETSVPGTPESLASQFGVDINIAELALRNVSGQLKRQKSADQASLLERFFAWIVKVWNKLTANVLLFLIGSSFLTSGFLFILDYLPKTAKTAIPIAGLLMLSLAFFIVPVLHALAVFFRGTSKDAMIAAVVWPFFSIIPIAVTNTDGSFPLGLAIAMYVSMLLIYSFVVIPTSVIGSYVRMKKAAKNLEGLSRQSMIERLIEIRSILSQKPEVVSVKSTLGRQVGFIEKYLEIISFLLAFILSAIASRYLAISDPDHILLDIEKARQFASKDMPPYMVVAGLVSLMSNVLAFGSGVASKNVKKLIFVYVAMCIGHFLTFFIPNGYFSVGMINSMGAVKVFSGYAMYAVFQGVGFMARQVYDFSQKAKLRHENDPDILIEEMLELEWRLTPTSSNIAVLAVDVVGSTAMKKDSDPMVTEWSFRAYQTWVARICAQHGGKVESTAGDGTILGFENCRGAVAAAIELQSRIHEFNQQENKLDREFVMRAGIHFGDVQGALGDVQFTRVIDIAAHIEGEAPVGSIAISDIVAQEIAFDGFESATIQKDGHEVYFWSHSPVIPSN